MPITKRRRRERGYNQCELITGEMSKGVSGHVSIFFINDLLLRVHHTSHQKNKDRTHRLSLEKGIFEVYGVALMALEKIASRDAVHLVLVDDVITTGSTIKEALETLSAAGFTNVRGLALSH